MSIASSQPAARSRRDRGSLADFVDSVGSRFSTELGIDLTAAKPAEVFKWWLAAMLFGARISGVIATRTYREFAKQRLLSPDRILRCGWDGLVAVLDRGGYARYDFKTATKLLDVCRALKQQYGSDLNLVHARSHSPQDLEQRLRKLGNGIGEVTVGIFLREMRGIWPKADPLPSDLVLIAAKELGVLRENLMDRKRALAELKRKWADGGGSLSEFPDFEAALLRRGLAVRRASHKRKTITSVSGFSRRFSAAPQSASV